MTLRKVLKGDIIYIAAVFALLVIVYVLYQMYAVPTAGRYCTVGTGIKNVEVMEAGNHFTVFKVINPTNRTIIINDTGIEVCIETSLGRVICERVGVGKAIIKELGPGDSLKLNISYNLDVYGVEVRAHAEWLKDEGVMVRAIKEAFFYITVDWVWTTADGSRVVYEAPLICKNYLSVGAGASGGSGGGGAV